ncbi:dienelactone hydrolase family protein [Phenylobacterium sp.]|jgi:dienelactone hydrolase|uniref:dienelactone hydrolase family protein n=1 Tax=Phenylobacterium sp. TaxID=1871053 RepID=UPI002F426C71
MPSETVNYEADGLAMKGQLFRPAGAAGPRPGVLVFPEAFGLGEHALSKAERVAGLGYVALACDLHGNALQVTDMEKMMGLLGPVASSPAKTRARAKGAFDALTAQPGVDAAKIAAIGYCFGGTMSLELGCSGAGLAGIAGFHSGLASVTAADAGNIKGRVLLCLGADDPGITPEHRAAFEAALKAGGVSWDLHLYGKVVHSFTNPKADALGRPDFARYDPHADAESFEAMRRLFEEVLDKAG